MIGSTMKNSITWNTDQFGRLLGLGLHDGYLYGLQFSDGKALTLQIRNCSGDIIEIQLADIADINIAQFCNGAILSDIYVWKVNAAPGSWSNPDSAWNILFTERLGLEGAKKEAFKIIQEKPDSLLVQVECSYGGAMVAICEHVEIVNESSESV
jgi:hypothetical protein